MTKRLNRCLICSLKVDKNISELHICIQCFTYVLWHYFLRVTKFNNYKQDRLSDNNHNWNFVVTREGFRTFGLNIKVKMGPGIFSCDNSTTRFCVDPWRVCKDLLKVKSFALSSLVSPLDFPGKDCLLNSQSATRSCFVPKICKVWHLSSLIAAFGCT